MQSQVLLDQLKSYLTRQRKANIIALVVFEVIMGGCVVGCSFIEARGDDLYWKLGIMGFFGLLLVLMPIHIYYELKKYHPETSKLLDIVHISNADGYFVWVYVLKHVRNGVASWHLVFRTIDKKKYQMSLPDESHTKFISMLQMVVSNVTFGYSKERLAQYNKDPKSLVL